MSPQHRLREIRLNHRNKSGRKISGALIAQRVGITPQYYYEIERGDRNLSTDLASTLADIFEVTTDYLLGKTERNLYDRTENNVSMISERIETKYNISRNSLVPDSAPVVEMVQIPIYGEIRAGYDSLAEQRIVGYEVVSRDHVKDGEYFYLIVRGDSMIDEGIHEGMRVLVKSQRTCEHGKIGVVIVNGDEGTLKRVFYDGDNVILQAANRDIPPRILPFHEVRIQGQVKKVEFDV